MKQKCNHYTAPSVYRGKSYVMRDCLTGRLFFPSAATPSWHGSGAHIAVLDPLSTDLFLASGDATSASAIVFVGDHPAQALCQFAVLHTVPLLILSRISPEHSGCIALLDSRTATLFVNPDLHTLARYARHLRGSADGTCPLSPLLCGAHRALTVGAGLFSSEEHLLCSVGGESLWAAEDEEDTFDALRGLAEESVGTPMILPVSTYGLHEEEGRAHLEARLRATLRAAVYGRLSLLFEGLCCAEDIRTVFLALECAAEALATERREFLRPRACGVAVESLLLLHELDVCAPVSFLCLDLDRLLRAAMPPYAGAHPPREAKEAFLKMLGRLLPAKQALICARTVHAPTAHAWDLGDAMRCGIDTFFVPPEHLSRWEEWRNGEKS